MGVLYGAFPIHPAVARDYSEIAVGISSAANADPLFPRSPAGSEATACLLVALAWTSSQMRKGAISADGRSLGLYQLQIPKGQRVQSSLVILPHTGSLVAIDRIRSGFAESLRRPLAERLVSFMVRDQGRTEAKALPLSAQTMVLADRLLTRYFPRAKDHGGLRLLSSATASPGRQTETGT